jgi:hypothetical protein
MFGWQAEGANGLERKDWAGRGGLLLFLFVFCFLYFLYFVHKGEGWSLSNR